MSVLDEKWDRDLKPWRKQEEYRRESVYQRILADIIVELSRKQQLALFRKLARILDYEVEE